MITKFRSPKLYNFSTIIILLTIIIFEICALHNQYPRSSFAQGIYPVNFSTGRIFFGFVSSPSSKRRNFPWKMYMHNLIQERFHQASFISQRAWDFPKYNIVPNETLYSLQTNLSRVNHSSDIDRMVKRLTGAQYLLNHPEIDWYWSLTDDVSIDMPEVNRMISRIQEKHNPRTEPIILGNCVNKTNSPINKTYLQGGVGYIMSRYAALKFIEFGQEYFKASIPIDDASFRIFIDSLNLTMDDVTIPNFHGPDKGYLIEPYYLDDFPYCPKEYKPIPECGYGHDIFYPLQIFNALHISDVRHNLKVWNRIMHLKKTRNDIYFYHHTDFAIFFCKSDKNLEPTHYINDYH